MPLEEALAIRESRRTSLRSRLVELLEGRDCATLEIGCGHGHFLTDYAAAHPDEFCLAIDIIAERLHRAAKKSARAGLFNLAWVLAEAVDLLAEWPDNIRLAPYIFVLFPDPWPKRRHWKNRLVTPEFLTALAARAAPGTALCFRTDHAPYFAQAVEVVAAHPDWVIDPTAPWPFERETVFQARAPDFQSFVAWRGNAAPSARLD